MNLILKPSLVRNLQLERGYTSLSLYSENNEERVITFDIVDNTQFAIVIFCLFN